MKIHFKTEDGTLCGQVINWNIETTKIPREANCKVCIRCMRSPMNLVRYDLEEAGKDE